MPPYWPRPLPPRWNCCNRQDRFEWRLARRTGDLLALTVPRPLLWLGYMPLVGVDDADEPFEQPIVNLWP